MRWGIAGLLLLLTTNAGAQTIKGKLFGQVGSEKEVLPGGLLVWVGTTVSATVNENGVFEISTDGINDKRLVASMMGYVRDTIAVGEKTYVSIVLKRSATDLKEVRVTDRSNAYISNLSVGKTEVITERELSKAACCDLAGCFGTQASVQPQTTNVITNAQELRILGLSGVYNQVLFDGLPMIYGVNYTYGISTYPGSIVDNIYVSKGTTSVLQGYESISGQINLESKQPDKTDGLFLNGYVNSFGEKHANANGSIAVGAKKKWHTMLALHMVQPSARIDGNKDGFMDLPLLTRYVAYNKWKYGNDRKKGFAAQIGLRIVNEKRIGGQMGYGETTEDGSLKVYGQTVRYTQPEGYAKTSYRFSDDHAISLSLAGFVHDQRSWFGTTAYTALQQSGYLNLQHEWLWREKHALKYGVSYRYQELAENVRFVDSTLHRTYAGDYLTRLRVPGAFVENSFHWFDDKIVLLAGVRVDQHQVWGGYVTPRSMLKYAVNDNHTFRASAGTGWRQVNLFSEQVNLLISSRDIIFSEALKPEEAFNWGLSHTYRFKTDHISGTLSGDFYSTQFNNQFFPDYDTDPTKVYVRNFTGESRSNGLQLEASLVFAEQVDFRVAYNYLDVYRIENGIRTNLPFNPKNRVMAAASFHTKDNQWQFDVNVHCFDKMKLPDTRNNPPQYIRPLYSTPYYTLNVQATFRWKKLDIYAGCENLLNYRQPNPIISADNPFGPYFDISSVWGPTRGREAYAGFRYRIK